MTAKQPAETLQPRKQLLPGEETTGETEEERIKPDIPATADYGGDEINFLFWQLSSWMGTVRQCRDIYSEGITGEAINDAVYNRNIKIEDAYKVKIALEMMDLTKSPPLSLRK